MPLRKPKKGESQSDFMAYCMHELSQSETKRPQEQKVAICMEAWREEHGGAKPKSEREMMIEMIDGIAAILDKARDDAGRYVRICPKCGFKYPTG